MDIDPAARKLLDEFAQILGLEPFTIEENGVSLSVDDSIVVDLQFLEESDDLLLFNDFGPPASGQAIYPKLLQANLFWRATEGATFAITDDEPAHVVLVSALSWRQFEAKQLVDAFESFLHTVEDWQEVLDTLDEDEEGSSDAAPRQDGMLRA